MTEFCLAVFLGFLRVPTSLSRYALSYGGLKLSVPTSLSRGALSFGGLKLSVRHTPSNGYGLLHDAQ